MTIWKKGLPTEPGRYAFAFDLGLESANRFMVMDTMFCPEEGNPYRLNSFGHRLIAHCPYPKFTERDLEELDK